MVRRFDLGIGIGCTLLQVLLVLLRISGPIRVASGFLLVSLWPGNCLLAAFYRPYRQDLSALEHIVLAVPTSLALSTILGLALDKLSLSIIPEAHVVWMGLVICGLAFLAMVRTQADDQNKWHFLTLLGGVFVVALSLGLLVDYATPQSDEGFLSLYMLDADGQTAHYPPVAAAGSPIQLIIGGSYEGESTQTFHLTSSAGIEIPLRLQPGDEWDEIVEFTLEEPGLHRVSWDLYREDVNKPARSVQLWIRVD